jgi:hypothetical protein
MDPRLMGTILDGSSQRDLVVPHRTDDFEMEVGKLVGDPSKRRYERQEILSSFRSTKRDNIGFINAIPKTRRPQWVQSITDYMYTIWMDPEVLDNLLANRFGNRVD